MPDLSDGVNWSEIDANNNNASPNGWPEGMMPSGVNDAARADRGAMKRFWNRINPVQSITPSGNLWTFTTDNIAYPTAYVAGEIYWFRPGAQAIGGDQFQVNGLAPKPIWKHVGFGAAGWGPIIARDFVSDNVQLMYDPNLNAGAGVFVLLNPNVPITGDGTGGVTMPGGLAVNGGDLMLGRTDQAYGYLLRPNAPGFNNLAFSAAGAAPLDDVNVITNTMHVAGQLSATGYTSRSGSAGPYQTNAFNVQWTGAGGAHLWIDSADQGQIITTSPAGDIVVDGSITGNGGLILNGGAGLTLNDSAGANIAGPIYSGGTADFAGHMTGYAGLSLNGGAGLAINNGGGLDVAGTGGFGGGLTVNGSLGGAIAIRATHGALQSDISGTALYLPNGDVVCQNVTAAVQGYKAGGGSWEAISDVRVKKGIKAYETGLDAVLALRPITYQYNGKGGVVADGREFVGLVADEVADVMPEMCGSLSERLDPADAAPTELKTLDVSALTFALVNAMREIASRLAALEDKQ